MMHGNRIETEGLTKHYGSRVGIEGLSLSVSGGSIFGFLGPNGAGKTTTIRILLGFLRAASGSAKVFGRDCWRESPEIRRRVGYLPGDLRLYPWMHGREALRLASAAHGFDVDARGSELLDYFELDPTVRVRSMSRGMRQKLGLVLALAHDPEALILDEPTTGLDPLTQGRLYARLRELASRGRVIFFSSHVLSEVEDLCDRVAILRAGHLVADETLDALRQRAGRAVTFRWQKGEGEDIDRVPGFLEVHEKRADVWDCGLLGPVSELLEWLRDKPVRDLSVAPPDLDTLFRRYYEDREP
ncbi:MAG: ABC transporter ATP-binding protein [Planctomycetota bacterium]